LTSMKLPIPESGLEGPEWARMRLPCTPGSINGPGALIAEFPPRSANANPDDGPVQRQEDGMMPNADMPRTMRSGAGATLAGGGSGVALRQNAVTAIIPSPTDGWPVVQADQASPSMVQPTGIKQKASPSDISTMPSRPTLMCRPEKVWTAPIPGGAWTRTFTGLGGFRFSGSLWCFSFSACLW
jgi:hypothetical protein